MMRFRFGSRPGSPGEGDSPAGSPTTRSISRRARATRPGCLVGFFAVFLLAGLGFLMFFLVPAVKVVKALSWEEVPCTILDSEVASHSDSDGTTYSVEVRYSYQVDWVEYTSNRYEFMGGSSSGYEGKAEVVERYPPGSQATCWVDPEDPTEAVLYRGFTWPYLFALLPLVFVAVGAGGIVFVLRGGRRSSAARAEWLPEPKAKPAVEGFVSQVPGAALSGPVQLEARASPLGKFVGMLFVAAFWNGITGIFVWQAVKGWQAGAGDGCLTVFLIPFVGVGLLLLAGVPYQFLALFNPRLHLTLSSATVALASSAQISWRFSGMPGRIRRLRIVLEGREEATYRRGTTTSTDREVFARLPVVDTEHGVEIATGNATLSLPEETMHSFTAPNNKVVWSLKVEGEIRYWPDVSEELELVVRPREGLA